MNDLISRHAAIEIIQGLYPGMPRIPWIRKDWQKRYEPYIRVENAIRELPSVQPEQKHGRWVKYKNWYACSECGNEMFFAGTYDESQHYCYNCGARMDGGTECD